MTEWVPGDYEQAADRSDRKPMIDLAVLSTLCDPERSKLTTPFRVTIGGKPYVMATDGRYAVAMEGDADVPAPPADLLRMVEEMLATTHGAAVPVRLSVAVLRAWCMVETPPCTKCGGTKEHRCGRCAGTRRAECRICDGSGTHTCFECDESHPCKPCSESGKVECPDCDDGKIDCPCATVPAPGRLLGRLLCRRQLGKMLGAIPSADCWVSARGASTDVFVFTGDGWRGLLMPVNERVYGSEEAKAIPVFEVP